MSPVKRLEKLYEGKAKIIYATDDPDLVIQYFKDDATAFDGKKKGAITDKGVLNNRISEHLFGVLAEAGIENQFVSCPSEREMLCKRLEIIQVEMIGRNIAAGSLAKRIGVPEGTVLRVPIVETYYKSDELGDPMLCDEHIFMLELATPEQLETMRETTRKINQVLTDYMVGRDIRLVDFKVEFGLHKGRVMLGDEISPDTCRLWDQDTNEKLDKDRFRRDLGSVEEAYQEVARRICG